MMIMMKRRMTRRWRKTTITTTMTWDFHKDVKGIYLDNDDDNNNEDNEGDKNKEEDNHNDKGISGLGLDIC